MRSALRLLLLLCALHASAQDEIRIWGDSSPRLRHVTLTPLLPTSGATGEAVIVCPGGSYSWLAMPTEGLAVGRWLRDNGIAAFVLKYRVQGIVPYITHSRLLFRGHQYPDALKDLQQAIRHVRQQAGRYGIDPRRVGAMGFSAGGHLAMLSAEQEKELRPDFVCAIYPVVSLAHPCSHKRSRRALLGERRKFSRKMRDSLSVERHVPDDCPPVFLINCKDDPVVKPHNAVLLDSALTARGIPHRFVQYSTGGHGFGTSEKKGTPECRAWKQEFLDWLKEVKKMKR